MSNQENTALVKSGSHQIEKVSQQLAISQKLIALTEPFYKKLSNTFTIRKAIALAKHSRLNIDGYFDPKEFDTFSESEIEKEILRRFKNSELTLASNIIFQLPKNKEVDRNAFYIPIVEYVIRFILGIVLFEEYKNILYKNVFGGKEDVFNTEKHNSFIHFKKWQQEIISKKEYFYLICLDIKSFFDSVEYKYLLVNILSKTKTDFEDYFTKLLAETLSFEYKKIENSTITIHDSEKGLIVGSAVDGFFQNIFLTPVDEVLKSIKSIQYGRLTDDIKIFCKNKTDGARAIKIIEQELRKIGLELNEDKTKWIDLTTDKLPDEANYSEASSFFDVHDNAVSDTETVIIYTEDDSGNIEFTEYYKDDLLEDDNWDKFEAAKVQDNNYSFNYFKVLLRKRPYQIKAAQIENMIYIIKNKIASGKVCAFFVNTFFKVSSQAQIKMCAKETINLFSDVLLHDYYKFCILRSLFLNRDKYYLKLISSDEKFKEKIKEQLILNSTSNNFIIRNTIEYLLKKHFQA